jgi:hypothetical protein
MSGPDLSWITGMLAGLAGSGVTKKIWPELQSYLADLGKNAAQKWGMHLLTEDSCSKCNRASFGLCDGCGEPTCLHHGRISREADILCQRCVRTLLGARMPPKKKPGRAKAPPPRQPRVPHDPERLEALRELGLTPSASWHDVRERFRELTSKWHPDKATPHLRKDFEERFKRMTAAYEVLKRRAAA